MNFTVTVEPCTRTDIICVACNRFNADHVLIGPTGEPFYGVHKRCIPTIRTKRGHHPAWFGW
jgi:hypothetical protein